VNTRKRRGVFEILVIIEICDFFVVLNPTLRQVYHSTDYP